MKPLTPGLFLKPVLALLAVSAAVLCLGDSVTPPELGLAKQPDGRLRLRWRGESNRVYLVQYKTNLLQANWDIFGGAVSTSGGTDVTVSAPAQGFYRLLVLASSATPPPKPTVKITSPATNQLWSNSVFTVKGTATDNSRLAAVFYQLNNSGWTSVSTTNKWTNWTATVSLVPGTNRIRAYAVDTNGVFSTTNSVPFVYVVTGILHVGTTGRGAVTPNYNNAFLKIGASYSMTATAAAGFAFTNWTGSMMSTNASLKFVMASNLSFTANFVDAAKPTVAITHPAPNQAVIAALCKITGTANDNVAVAAVWYRLNKGPWLAAATTNHWTNWTATAALIAGANSIDAYAVDTTGHRSLTTNAAFTLKTKQLLESVSQTVLAASGGTLTLPGGSSLTIPPGLLTNNMLVTLYLKSSLTVQPPSGIIAGVGPALIVSFAPAPPRTHIASLAQLAPGVTPVNQPQLTLILGGGEIAGVAGSGEMVDAVDLSGGNHFVGIPGSPAGDGATFYPPPGLFANGQPIECSLGNVRPQSELAPMPDPGAKIWNGAEWVDGTAGIDPRKKTLILVHGMLSSVENAYDAATIKKLMAAGGYQQVVGFDYDWTDGIDVSGLKLAFFLHSLHAAGLASADMEAHSEGVAVTLSAACQDADLPIGNIAMLGGPIMGTPAASLSGAGKIAGLLANFSPLGTTLLNLPAAQFLPPGRVPPGKTFQDILNGQFAPDLAPNSAALANDRQCVINQMANSGSPLSATKLITACGYTPFAGMAPATIPGLLMSYLFPDGSDGIIPPDSAGAVGAGFNPARHSQLACYPLTHTELTGNTDVINDVALHLNGAPSAYTLTTTASPAGGGSIDVDPLGPYARGLGFVVTLKASAADGYFFAGWSGDAMGQGTATVKMTTNRTVTATFKKLRTLTIATTGSGDGTVAETPWGYRQHLAYTNGTSVTLTATPDSFSRFAGWTGALSSQAPTIYVLMNADKSLTAKFNLKPLYLSGDGGKVGASIGSLSQCGYSTGLSLADLVHFQVSNNGSGQTTATVSADVDADAYGEAGYGWQGTLDWNGSSLTGSLPRTDSPGRPAVSLTITRNSAGSYIASATIPFTYHIYLLDGGCSGPLLTFNYRINGLVLTRE